MKKSILFVDDEPHLLEGLANRLRRQRRHFKMTFALGAQKALEALEREPFEVVVSDMRMPGMDGAQFLRQVRARWPEAIRVILTGQSDQNALIRALPVAHQFLKKPCPSGKLEELLKRCCQVKELLDNTTLRSAVGGVESLPVMPEIYTKLTQMLESGDAAIDDIAGLIGRDVGMSGRILHLVNSSFFSIGRPISQIREAATYLGLDTLRHLVLTAEIFRSFDSVDPKIQPSLRRLQRHAMKTARIAAHIAPDPHTEDAFTAGLLHDVGLLLMGLHLPEHFGRIACAEHGDEMTEEAEREVNGFTHAQAGGYLLSIWDLPYPLVEAVAFHHRPEDIEHSDFNVLSAVYVANLLADENPVPPGEAKNNERLTHYLGRFGLAEQIDDWRHGAADFSGTEDVAA